MKGHQVSGSCASTTSGTAPSTPPGRLWRWKSGVLGEKGGRTYGGRWVVNPSGGLTTKGHAPGATRLAQCAELTGQPRGAADARQMLGARVAVHNLGLCGAAVVTIYAVPSERVA